MKRLLVALCTALLVAGVAAMPVAGRATSVSSPATPSVAVPACRVIVNAPHGRVNLMATAKVVDTTGGTRISVTFTLLQGATVRATWAAPSMTTDAGGNAGVHHNWRDLTAGVYTVRTTIVRTGTATSVCGAIPDVPAVTVGRR